ncbi:unnamed protein product [Musa acuminata subsp. malaccensis]|uniref:(wild Malaysian banana) hypothetical protein n=1 Tax=Musa acuminata subsp. malaccensis TaxID=214687 RepID=A0A804KQU6_MUSAM|nr:unnamed protein product [Musa acuminata subsp. malaccensis]
MVYMSSSTPKIQPCIRIMVYMTSTSFSCLLTTIMASIKDEILLHDSVVAGHQTASAIIPRVTQPCSPIIIIPESGRIKNKQL